MMTEEKTIKDLGTRTGKLLFFGGVYSNLQALEALQQWAVANHFAPENIFCTGDMAGYCAHPVECFQLMKEWGIHTIAGNVELQLRNGEDHCGCDFRSGGRCDLFSRNWYAYAQSKMNPETIDWLHTLPQFIRLTYGEKQLLVVHGSWFHTAEFVFASTPWAVKQKNFEAAGVDVIVGGHCGLPFADVRHGKHWLNAGVIGMPANDGTDRVWFLTVQHNNAGEIDYRFHSLQYNHTQASDAMQEAGLPASYASTLATGIWDNCEILPEKEAAQQGKAMLM